MISSSDLKMSGFQPKNVQYPRYQDTDFLQLWHYMTISDPIWVWHYLICFNHFEQYWTTRIFGDPMGLHEIPAPTRVSLLYSQLFLLCSENKKKRQMRMGGIKQTGQTAERTGGMEKWEGRQKDERVCDRKIHRRGQKNTKKRGV